MQTRQFCRHNFVHIFALYVGVGVSKRFPIVIKIITCNFFVFGGTMCLKIMQLQLHFSP